MPTEASKQFLIAAKAKRRRQSYVWPGTKAIRQGFCLLRLFSPPGGVPGSMGPEMND